MKLSNSTWKYRGDNQYQNAPIKYRGDNQYQNALTVVGIEDSGSELERLPDFVTIHPLTLNREKLKGKHFVDILKNAIFRESIGSVICLKFNVDKQVYRLYLSFPECFNRMQMHPVLKVCLQVAMVMPALLLQKRHRKSKAQEHSVVLNRRLKQ